MLVHGPWLSDDPRLNFEDLLTETRSHTRILVDSGPSISRKPVTLTVATNQDYNQVCVYFANTINATELLG